MLSKKLVSRPFDEDVVYVFFSPLFFAMTFTLCFLIVLSLGFNTTLPWYHCCMFGLVVFWLGFTAGVWFPESHASGWVLRGSAAFQYAVMMGSWAVGFPNTLVGNQLFFFSLWFAVVSIASFVFLFHINNQPPSLPYHLREILCLGISVQAIVACLVFQTAVLYK